MKWTHEQYENTDYRLIEHIIRASDIEASQNNKQQNQWQQPQN